MFTPLRSAVRVCRPAVVSMVCCGVIVGLFNVGEVLVGWLVPFPFRGRQVSESHALGRRTLVGVLLSSESGRGQFPEVPPSAPDMVRLGVVTGEKPKFIVAVSCLFCGFTVCGVVLILSTGDWFMFLLVFGESLQGDDKFPLPCWIVLGVIGR